MDGTARYSDNIFVERLWRTVKYEEVYLKAYANVTEARRELEDYFRFYNDRGPIRPWDTGRRPRCSAESGMWGKRSLMKGGVHRGPEHYYWHWQECRDSHLIPP